MTFKTAEELLTQALSDGACNKGLKWAEGKNLDEILRNIPIGWRVWCLRRGYDQFAEHCDWTKLSGEDWAGLLCYQPQFAKYREDSK